MALSDYLSWNPISKPERNENYEEEYVITCIIPLLEFNNTQGSITDPITKGIQTDKDKEREL